MQFDAFTSAYIAAALQLSEEEIGTGHTLYTLPIETLNIMQSDCLSFQQSNAEELAETDQDQAGTDFFLSRNGHGSGYWSRPQSYGDYTEMLQANAESYGPADLYLGDDKRVYHYPAA